MENTHTQTGEEKNTTSRIVEKVIESLSRGDIPWRKPWKSSAAYNAVSLKKYTGINSLVLNCATGCPDSRFLTYKQAAAMGAQVRRGEKGWPVIYYSTMTKEVQSEGGGEAEKKNFRFMKHYTVFNASQIDGMPASDSASAPVEVITPAEKIVHGMPQKPTIGEGNRACYLPSIDRIEMPPRTSNWTSSDAYYSTLFHELTHATGHESRLKRDLEGMRYGKDGNYAREELVAEIGAHFLSQSAGLNLESLQDNTVAYCQGWARAIKSDPKAIFYAAAKAQTAHNYIMGIKREENGS